jgi:hypothetical protein
VVEEAGYGRLETPGVGGVGVWGCGWFRDGRQGDLLNHRRRGAASSTADLAGILLDHGGQMTKPATSR